MIAEPLTSVQEIYSLWGMNRLLCLWSCRILNICGKILIFKRIMCFTGRLFPESLFKKGKSDLKISVLIGFNESMTFQGNPTISGTADLNRIHIKEALGLQQWARLTAGGQETHYSVILWLSERERAREREAGAESSCREKRRESEENKCERKILNDQNSSHKTLGLMPSLLLWADRAVQLCQLPSMLHHGNTAEPQRGVLNSRRDLSSIKLCILLFLYGLFPTAHGTEHAAWCSAAFSACNELHRWSWAAIMAQNII